MTVSIGSKYVGKAESRNFETGEYWSVMHGFTRDEAKLQRLLIAKQLVLRVKLSKKPSLKWVFWK